MKTYENKFVVKCMMFLFIFFRTTFIGKAITASAAVAGNLSCWPWGMEGHACSTEGWGLALPDKDTVVP